MGFTSLMTKMMAKGGSKIKEQFFTITQDPQKEQSDLLMMLIDRAKDSEFGKKYDFASIKSVKDFQERIPLTDYDFYSEYVHRMAEGNKDVLTSAKIVHFNKTSGTLGVPKKIPVTNDQVKLFSDYHAKYINYLASEKLGYGWTKGKGLSLTEGTYQVLPSGITYGSASSLMAAKMGKMIPFLQIDMLKTMYTSPIEARQPESGTPTRYLHSRFALAETNVTYANATFVSYLLEIMRYIEDNKAKLVNDIRTGTIDQSIDMPENVRQSLLKKLKPMPKRADELQKIFDTPSDVPLMKRLWPKLQFIICVGGAGFSIYTQKLKDRYCGNDIDFVFLGLTASEGMFSVPYELNNTNAAFVPGSVFMEFMPVEDGETIEKCLLLHEVEIGKKYEIVVTTRGGLYRYRMKDTVLITGKFNNTPTMEFVNRSGFAVSMFGEKTSDLALQRTVINTAKELNLDVYDYAVYPDSDSVPGKYVMLLELRGYDGKKNEQIRAALQKHLGVANPSMEAKFRDGVCGQLELKLLQPETFLLYRDLMIMKGTSAAQLKPVHVLGTPFLKKFFYAWEEQY